MLDELRTFIAVVEYKNFTKAARAINMSQPSVSLHVRHLEEYFNTTLIQRSVKQKNIVITQAGNLLYDKGKRILKLLDDTREELIDYSEAVKGSLHIGASYTIGEYFLPAFLGEFSRKYPQLELQVTIENTQNICDKVKNFQVDIGLTESPILSSNFLYEHFYEDEMVVALPYNHPFANNPFSAKLLQNQTWISREEGSGTREYLNMFLSNNNIHPKNIIVFGSNYSVKEGVKNRLGITFISSLVTEGPVKNKEISLLETNQKYTRNFSYILPKGVVPSKVVKVFTNMLMRDIGSYSNGD